MTMGKRQLVLAALVVALGAAVYLNWVFAGNTTLPATQAVTSGGRELGQTLMVNGSAVSGKTANASAASGKAVSGKANVSSTKGSAVKTSANAGSNDEYFNEARLSRQKTQDTAKEDIAKILEDAKSSDAVKKEAVDKAAVITQNMLKETDIENLVKAKGFSDCVVTINNGQCSVVVKTKANAESDAVVIQDIVAGQTGLSFDKIKIIERV
ncbi:MAG TPA: SpoIIIAH-like family protein [Caproicibacter sp.]|nr:SpoIIIAH-like family protein [Caproicibacter sp.]